MGWTYTHKPKSQTIEDFFFEQGVTRWSSDVPHTYKVLASALVGMKTWYAAIEQVHKETGERRVWAAVILVNFVRVKRGEYFAHNFGWKDMDESMGPCEAQCPERILDLLTETEHEYAKDWRARCRAYHATSKVIPKLTHGVVMKFTEPVKFGDFGEADYFKVLRTKGSAVICSTQTLGISVRMSRAFIKSRVARGGVVFS